MRSLLPRFVALAALALVSCGASAQPAAARKVAVFSEPGFPYYGVDAGLLPSRIAADLKMVGIAAETVGADALADPARVNAKGYAAVVLPYGNTFAVMTQANLRAFHEAGGSLILSGIPFTHRVVRRDGGWADLGHSDDPARFGPTGVGAGGFAGPGAPGGPTIPAADPLGIAPLALHWERETGYQWLDPASLPAGDTIEPAIGDADRPFAAIVTHKAAPFAGAVDVWVYHAPHDDTEAWATEQLLARGVVVAFQRRGLLTAAQQQAAFTKLAAVPRPRVYTDIVLPQVPRPYLTFQPKMPPPARTLYVADIRKMSRDERVLLLSLQGLVNRTKPRVFLFSEDDDPFWLDVLRQQGTIDAPINVDDPLSLVKTFRSSFRGVVVPDPKVYVTPCVAATVAGIEDCLVATPELAKRLGLPIRVDLRGKFHSGGEALRYGGSLLPKLNPYLSCCLDPAVLERGAIDQIIAAKGMVFWITGSAAQNLPGADGAGELAAMKEIFSKMPLESVVRGFWWHGENVGVNEGPGVSLASRFGKVTVVSDFVSNFSVLSGVPDLNLKQKTQAPPPALDRNKVYFAFTMSDGDNLCTWRGYFRKYFTDPLHGTFPIGWGMGPTLVDCAPSLARWYYDQATPNDEFLCDVSGVGYIYGPDWGTALKDREGAFADFYGWTEKYMQRLDMRTVRLMNVGVPDIAQAAGMMPGVKFLMPDYGNTGTHTYPGLTYTLPSGHVVFRAVTDSASGATTLARQIRERIGSTRPAFANVFIWNWGNSLAELKKTIDLLGPEYVAVTPSQLYALQQQAAGKTTVGSAPLAH